MDEKVRHHPGGIKMTPSEHGKTATRDLNDLVDRGLFQKSGIKRGTRYTLI